MLWDLIFVALILIALATLWIWTNRRRRPSEAQTLAVALIAEISGTLEIIETQQIEKHLNIIISGNWWEPISFSLLLPHFVIYESSANKLNRLGHNLAHKVTSLFDSWIELVASVNSLGSQCDGLFPAEILDELYRTRHLANELLIGLRKIAYPHLDDVM